MILTGHAGESGGRRAQGEEGFCGSLPWAWISIIEYKRFMFNYLNMKHASVARRHSDRRVGTTLCQRIPDDSFGVLNGQLEGPRKGWRLDSDTPPKALQCIWRCTPPEANAFQCKILEELLIMGSRNATPVLPQIASFIECLRFIASAPGRTAVCSQGETAIGDSRGWSKQLA